MEAISKGLRMGSLYVPLLANRRKATFQFQTIHLSGPGLTVTLDLSYKMQAQFVHC